MSEIDELQRRISTAMDRVAKGIEAMDAVSAGPDPEMAQALEDERTANAQLSERIKVLKERSETDLAEMGAQREAFQNRIAELDLELQRVRGVNKELHDACSALINANKEGVCEPHLINRALLAELVSLRAGRAADVAEMDAVLSSLTPLVEAAGVKIKEGEA